MKTIAAIAALGFADAGYLSRSDVRQFTALFKNSINNNENFDKYSPSIVQAAQAYVNGPDFKVPNEMPEKMINWFNQQTGRVECDEDCAPDSALDLTALHGYGCWCFFGNIDSLLGRGPPLDAYDAICQKLALCYRCVIVDAENEDDDCDPFTVSFQASLQINGAFGIQNVSSSCQTDNEANCAWRTCTCAMTMITNFFNLSFDSSNVYDDNMVHDNGFEYNVECPTQGKADDRQCCGFYPNRRTFDNGDANRACCHERSIYNPIRHQCCEDGTHVGLGSRC